MTPNPLIVDKHEPRRRDGCRRGAPLANGVHDLTGSLGSYDGERMACTKERYVSQIQSCIMSEELDEELGTGD